MRSVDYLGAAQLGYYRTTYPETVDMASLIFPVNSPPRVLILRPEHIKFLIDPVRKYTGSGVYTKKRASKPNLINLVVKAAVSLATYGALTDSRKSKATGKGFAHTICSQHLGTDREGAHFLLQYGIALWFLV
ncbi:hypothetical protein LT330_006606 [Penicillium expansum]|nr:hypothetical protein LT330_006606 [Penicillium expansum]